MLDKVKVAISSLAMLGTLALVVLMPMSKPITLSTTVSETSKIVVPLSFEPASDDLINTMSKDTLRSSDVILSEAPKIPTSLEYYINDYSGEITFGGGEVVFPNTYKAVSRAFSSVGDALSICQDGKCFNKCDHLAGDIWGYEEASGYLSAMTHWQTAVAQGIAVRGDKEPPLGALLFWETGRPFGHVATYIGNGMVVTNAGGEYGSNVYIYYADWYDMVNYKYLGWAPPVFFGEEPGSAL